MKRVVIILLLAVMFPFVGALAQETCQTNTISVKVYFRQGYSTFETSFMENGARLEEFIARLSKADASIPDSSGTIRIIGTASPEGSTKMNKALAKKRAANLTAWLKSHPEMQKFDYETNGIGIDWEGLAILVENSDMPYRDEAVDIIRNTPEWIIKDGKVTDGRQRQLGMLRGGQPWKYMDEHLFQELRSTSIEIVCEIVRNQEKTVTEDSATATDTLAADTALMHETVTIKDTIAEKDTVAVQGTAIMQTQSDERKPFFMAVKTNMLYDLALVPNIGVEFHLSKGWTIGGSWMYAWWKSDRKNNYWRTYGGELNLRKYFGRKAGEKPLQGHHLGLYGQLLTYDFELGGRGYLGDKWSWGAGIEYGYSLPVAKRLNIDFAIGAGYLGGKYMEYLPMDGHYVWQATKQRHWFGPTKAEISLVWLIGHGNNNPNKGGKR